MAGALLCKDMESLAPEAKVLPVLKSRLGTLDPIIIEYAHKLVVQAMQDFCVPEEVRELLAPMLEDHGVDAAAIEALFETLEQTFLADKLASRRQTLPDIVALETPLAMRQSLSGEARSAGAKESVSLDWLSSRKVMPTQVDGNRLKRIEERRRLRLEKRERKELEMSRLTLSMAGNGLEDSSEDELGLDIDPTRASRDIRVENFDIDMAGKRILTNADLTLAYGHRYGLIGRNGIGKTTLLRAIVKREISVPKHISILHVEQEVAGDDTTALQSVLLADKRRERLLAEEKRLQEVLLAEKTGEGNQSTLALSKRLESVYQCLEEIEADSAEARASIILIGLGFTHADQQRSTKTFSGGWRMRLSLARALFCRPDLLLLDEPTNMLDIPAVVWLQRYLSTWPSTLLVVSHDRYFLDAVATDIIHQHEEKLDFYRGNYLQFLQTRDERLKNYEREYEAQQQYRAHLQAFIDRWRYNANRAPQAQSRIKILEKLPVMKPLPPKVSITFVFPPVEAIPPPLVVMDEVCFGYSPENIILRGINFGLQPGSKIAIVGPNGAGKTTFLKLMTDQLAPTSGRVQLSGRLRIAYFSQHFVDQLDLSLNSVQLMASRFPGKTDEEYRRQLGSFGLSGPLALQKINTLSGGQKSRVVFATLNMIHPHVLILDEPTNHLDMDSIDALISALRKFEGGVVVVSHDQRFVDALCEEIWVCADGAVKRYNGTIMEYAESLILPE